MSNKEMDDVKEIKVVIF